MQIPDPGHITPSVNRLDAVFGSIGSGAAGQWQLQQDVPAFKGGRDVDAAADDSDEEAPPQQLMPQALIDDSEGLSLWRTGGVWYSQHCAVHVLNCKSLCTKREMQEMRRLVDWRMGKKMKQGRGGMLLPGSPPATAQHSDGNLRCA
eukprot:645642-Pelagomonas_calceolata.AAC.2